MLLDMYILASLIVNVDESELMADSIPFPLDGRL